jgi:hypothetical protein
VTTGLLPKRTGPCRSATFQDAASRLILQATGVVSLDSYQNVQAAGIEPPRLRGLETDPAMAARQAPPPTAGSGVPPVGASLDGQLAGMSLAAAAAGGGGEAALHASLDMDRAADRSADVRRSMPAGGGAVDSWRAFSADAGRPGSLGPGSVGPGSAGPASTVGDDEDTVAWRSMPDPGRQYGGGTFVDTHRSYDGAARSMAAAGVAAEGADPRRGVEAGPLPSAGMAGGVSDACPPRSASCKPAGRGHFEA